MAALGEQQVEVELLRQPLVQLDARVVELRALGGLVVRAQNRGVPPWPPPSRCSASRARRRSGISVFLLAGSRRPPWPCEPPPTITRRRRPTFRSPLVAATSSAGGRCQALSRSARSTPANWARHRDGGRASSTTVHTYSPTAQPNSSRNRSVSCTTIMPGWRAIEPGRKLPGGATWGRRSSAGAEPAQSPPGLGGQSMVERGGSTCVTSTASGGGACVTSEEQGSRRSQLTYPRIAFALGLAELAGDVVALELELAQMRDVGPPGLGHRRAVVDGDVPAVAHLESGHAGAARAFASPSGCGATAVASAAAGLRNARLTSGAPRRRGRRTASSGSRP